MRMWQEDVRAAGMDPSTMPYPMHQYGHGRGHAPIFITNQPPVPFQQGQSAYAGQHVPPGYPGQPFPQGQTAVPSNNLPNATM